jgi:tripartite-type tricarboxylate transporter receptor subunit TctC
MFKQTLATCALALCALACGPGIAQDAFPTRPIKLVVPYAAGGPADLLARILADKLPARLGQPVVVENRGGSGGHVGGEMVAKSPPDGYTLALTTIAHNGAVKLYRNLRYDPLTDLQSVILLAESPSVLLVHDSVPARSVKELIALAQAKPGGMSYGSAGNGSAMHMAAELFKHMAKIHYVHIPYRGGAPAMADLLGGQVQFLFESVGTSHQYIKTGRVRALAVTSEKRNATLPDVPTMAEAGVPGYSSMPWYTISAPKGVPPAVLAKLNAEINAVLKLPDVAQRLDSLGVLPIGGTPADAQRRNEAETRKWSAVIDAAHMTAE